MICGISQGNRSKIIRKHWDKRFLEKIKGRNPNNPNSFKFMIGLDKNLPISKEISTSVLNVDKIRRGD
jgi:hypothetical protein